MSPAAPTPTPSPTRPTHAAAAATAATARLRQQARTRPRTTAVIATIVLACVVGRSSASWAGPGREGNPQLGNRMHLVAQTDLSLSIWPDGSVRGSADINEYGLLEVTSVGFNQEVRLRGVKTGLFLAMNAQGALYGEADADKDATVFVSGVSGAYNTYQARAHAGEASWFVGLKRRGSPKPGPLTRPDQKAARFLPVRPDARANAL